MTPHETEFYQGYVLGALGGSAPGVESTSRSAGYYAGFRAFLATGNGEVNVTRMLEDAQRETRLHGDRVRRRSHRPGR